MGVRVILIDADLGGANLHTLLGISPSSVSLSDFIKKRVTHLQEALIPTAIPNLQLLTGAQDLLNASEAKSCSETEVVALHQSNWKATISSLIWGPGMR